ncbi:MAG: hypothetical protein GF364_00065, partial [Candidatus Lokiarchaeota archaeon]|nr:hypothetical protein [Candidatus Lokiarchaeota archaeon]
LYPDTDSREIILNKEQLKTLEQDLPDYPWDLIEEYSKKYKINKNIFSDLLLDGYLPLFDKIMVFFKGKPMLVATTFLEMVTALRRDGYDIDNLSDENMVNVFKLINQKKIAKEAIETVLQYLCEHPDENVEDSIEKMNISSMKKEDLVKIVQNIVPQFKDLIEERNMGAMGPVMGAVMKEVRGKIDGKIVSQVVKAEIQKKAKKKKSGGK